MVVTEYQAVVVFSICRSHLATPGRFDPDEDVANDLVVVKRIVDPGDSVLDHLKAHVHEILSEAVAMHSNRFACRFTIRGSFDYWGEYEEYADFELIPIGLDVERNPETPRVLKVSRSRSKNRT